MPTNDFQMNQLRRVNVGDFLKRSASREPKKVALIEGDRRITYAEFNAWANRAANGLLQKGLKPGDAFALMSGNCAEFLVSYFACAKIGVVCVPINLFWRDVELKYVLEHARVKGVIVQKALRKQLQSGLDLLPGLDVICIDPEDDGPGSFSALCANQSSGEPEAIVEDNAPLSYLYTSGTTSAPKGVVTSHNAEYIQSLGSAIDMRITSDDVVGAMMPMFHTGQLNAFCTPAVAVGASICIMPGYEANRLFDAIEDHKVSIFFGLPMMFRNMLEVLETQKRDLSSMRLAIYAMAPMPDTDLRKCIDVFKCGFSLLFGQTEMAPVTAFFRPEHQLSHSGAVGTPAVNVEVAIMDTEGNLLPQGEKGEIVYRSPQTLSGYLYNQEATDEAFRFGWFHSGDAGYFGEDGILWFEDRYKDVIKSGGENVASIEVEKALYKTEPRLNEVVVVGLPHQKWGEAITAVVLQSKDKPFEAQDLMTRVRENLAPFKCPKSVIFVEEMPKTATGKIQKAKLRQMYATHYDNLS